MKKFLPFILLAAFATKASAQTVTFSLPTVPCHNNGVLVATMAGFTPPLTVTWTTNGTTSTSILHTVTGLTDALTSYSGGPVNIFVTDGVNTAFDFYAGAPPFSYTLSTTEAICPAPGTATVAVSGGSAPYTYQWYNVANSAIVGTGATISQPTGEYGVVITDAAGCTYGSRVNTDNGLIGYTSFNATLSATDANCTNGTAAVTGVGATAVLPVSYAWSNGATTSEIADLVTGDYYVTVVDAAGCKATAGAPGMAYVEPSVFVNQLTTLSTAISATPATCTLADGSISVAVSGGTAPYSYLWSNGATTDTQSALMTGSYDVTVRDANGCIANDFGSVGYSSPISVTSSSSPSLCTSPTGNATIVPSGGTGTYAITWYTTPAYTGATATFLAPGDYVYKVTDGAGCQQFGSVTVNPVNIISTSFSATSAICTLANGSLSVMPMGGVAPYTYSWSTGATTPGISSVAPGNYSVTVTDNMGCKAKVSHEVASNSSVGVGLSTTPASCIYANDGTVTATAFGGTAPYSYGWSSGGTTATISALQPGSYWMHVTDAAGCTASAYTYVGYDPANTSCYCTIQGTIFADTNGNCSQEPAETGIAHIQVFCSGVGYTYTDANGGYSFRVPSGSYTITENAPAFYPLAPCQTNNISVATTAGTGCVNTVNFANSVIPVHNLAISTSSATQPVPGNAYIQQLTLVNDGSMMEDSVFTGYKSDGQFYAPLTFTPSALLNGSGTYYSNTPGFLSLAPGASATFYASYQVPTNMAAGTNITFRDSVANNAPMDNYLADYTPANNTNTYIATVVAAEKASFTEVNPKGSGASGFITLSDSVLQYTIHFRNTGSWFAENVMVTDTLDGNLDWSTLHPMAESAPCKVSVAQAGASKVATFMFSDINLAPQMFGDMRSEGSFTYSIKMLPGLAVGTQIRNRASIMFDQLEPEVTNTTLNTITANPILVHNTPSVSNNSFTVYPNPATTSFNAIVNSKTACTAAMTISDVTGKTLLAKNIALQAGSQTVATDIANFAAGIYFVSINENGRTQTQKLIVIR